MTTQVQHWANLDPDFCRRLTVVFNNLSARGFKPRIASSWRSIEEQAELVKKGNSKVLFSFHNNITDQGGAAALAADVIDLRYGWKLPDGVAFFRALGEEASAQGMTWGGNFVSGKRDKYGLGWDPSHVQALPNSDLPAVRERCFAVAGQLRTQALLAASGVKP